MTDCLHAKLAKAYSYLGLTAKEIEAGIDDPELQAKKDSADHFGLTLDEVEEMLALNGLTENELSLFADYCLAKKLTSLYVSFNPYEDWCPPYEDLILATGRIHSSGFEKCLIAKKWLEECGLQND